MKADMEDKSLAPTSGYCRSITVSNSSMCLQKELEMNDQVAVMC